MIQPVVTIQPVLRQYAFNLAYAGRLVDDLSDEQMTLPGDAGLENHPAFTLGHLVSGSAGMAEDLGAPFDMPVGWAELFLRKGPGDPRLPDPDGTKYPSRRDLLDELALQHRKVESLAVALDPRRWGETVTWRFAGRMPTLFDLFTFMCVNHEAMHLGQLAAWRRAMGLPSALASL